MNNLKSIEGMNILNDNLFDTFIIIMQSINYASVQQKLSTNL